MMRLALGFAIAVPVSLNFAWTILNRKHSDVAGSSNFAGGLRVDERGLPRISRRGHRLDMPSTSTVQRSRGFQSLDGLRLNSR